MASSRAKPELLCPVWGFARLPLPDSASVFGSGTSTLVLLYGESRSRTDRPRGLQILYEEMKIPERFLLCFEKVVEIEAYRITELQILHDEKFSFFSDFHRINI